MMKGLIPDSFPDWRMTVLRLPGRLSVTATRCGVTILIVKPDGEPWTVTKMHKGRTLGTATTINLPKQVLDTIKRRGREQRAGETRYLAGRR